jgi:hypothetical protein
MLRGVMAIANEEDLRIGTFGLGCSGGAMAFFRAGERAYLPCSIKVYTPFEADCENPSSMVKFPQKGTKTLTGFFATFIVEELSAILQLPKLVLV